MLPIHSKETSWAPSELQNCCSTCDFGASQVSFHYELQTQSVNLKSLEGVGLDFGLKGMRNGGMKYYSIKQKYFGKDDSA